MQPSEYEAMFQAEDRMWWFRGMQAISRALLDQRVAHVARGGQLRLLDAGCGTGGALCMLADYGSATGLELEGFALRLARSRGLVSLAQGTVAAMPFASNSFDLVTCFDVLTMLDDAAEAAALSELARLAAPGGQVLVRVAAHDWLRGNHDRVWHIVRRYSPARLRAGLAGAGLVVEHFSHANMWLFPIAAARRLTDNLLPPRAKSDVAQSFGPLDGLFGALLASEARLIARRGLPIGLSLIALARKPPLP